MSKVLDTIALVITILTGCAFAAFWFWVGMQYPRPMGVFCTLGLAVWAFARRYPPISNKGGVHHCWLCAGDPEPTKGPRIVTGPTAST